MNTYYFSIRWAKTSRLVYAQEWVPKGECDHPLQDGLQASKTLCVI